MNLHIKCQYRLTESLKFRKNKSLLKEDNDIEKLYYILEHKRHSKRKE